MVTPILPNPRLAVNSNTARAVNQPLSESPLTYLHENILHESILRAGLPPAPTGWQVVTAYLEAQTRDPEDVEIVAAWGNHYPEYATELMGAYEGIIDFLTSASREVPGGEQR